MRHTFNKPKLTAPPFHSFFYVYLFGLVWAIVYAIFTPPTIALLLSKWGVEAWMLYTAVAAIIGMVGIVRESNLLVERLGVSMLAVTPLLFSVAQIGIVIYELVDPGDDIDINVRISSFVLGLWLFYPLFWRQRDLTSRVKLARRTPLQHELEERKN